MSPLFFSPSGDPRSFVTLETKIFLQISMHGCFKNLVATSCQPFRWFSCRLLSIQNRFGNDNFCNSCQWRRPSRSGFIIQAFTRLFLLLLIFTVLIIFSSGLATFFYVIPASSMASPSRTTFDPDNEISKLLKYLRQRTWYLEKYIYYLISKHIGCTKSE